MDIEQFLLKEKNIREEVEALLKKYGLENDDFDVTAYYESIKDRSTGESQSEKEFLREFCQDSN